MLLRYSQLVTYSVFAILFVFFAMVGYFQVVPSTSEFWGLNPHSDPRHEALLAFEGGDYRFLAVRYKATQHDTLDHIPGINGCDNHPDGTEVPPHFTQTLPQFDPAVLERVRNYGRSYNFSIAAMLNEHHAAECRILYTF